MCLINNDDPIIFGVSLVFIPLLILISWTVQKKKQSFVAITDLHVLSVLQSARWWSVRTRPAPTASTSSRTDWSCTTRQTMLTTEDSDICLLACKHTPDTCACTHTHMHIYRSTYTHKCMHMAEHPYSSFTHTSTNGCRQGRDIFDVWKDELSFIVAVIILGGFIYCVRSVSDVQSGGCC